MGVGNSPIKTRAVRRGQMFAQPWAEMRGLAQCHDGYEATATGLGSDVRAPRLDATGFEPADDGRQRSAALEPWCSLWKT